MAKYEPDALGFQLYGLVEDTPYEPPENFPPKAREYLLNLSRCGTISGACKLSDISTASVYKYRGQISGFESEEEIAKSVLTDSLEQSLMEAGLGLDDRVQGSARVRALETALKAMNAEKYNRPKEVDVSAEMSWIDILKQAEQAREQEEDDE